MSEFVINHYSDDKPNSVTIKVSEDIVYAEDIVISLAKKFGINRIARHLFGLYHRNNKIWLSSNQLLLDWTETKTLDFRIRFRPKHINVLKVCYNLVLYLLIIGFNLNVQSICKKLFNYFFNQIRNDFACGYFECENDSKIYGLSVADMARESLKNGGSNFDKIIDDFFTYLPLNCKKPKSLLFKLFSSTPKEKITDAFNKALTSSRQNADPIGFIQQSFIEDFITFLSPDYWSETYSVMYDKRYDMKRPNLMDIVVQYRHYSTNGPDQPTGIFCKNKDPKDEWTHFCSICEIGFISLDSKNKRVEISRTNGVPFAFTFKHDLQMKSFVSLLDGYYRLSVKWSFNICKDISSPSLAELRKHKTHGPVDHEFVLNKFKEKANDTIGAYILRESASKYDEYKLDVFVGHELFETFKLRVINNQIEVNLINRYFESYDDLIKNFSFFISDDREVTLTHCITPSEHDLPSNLLLCRLDTKENSNQTEADKLGPPVIPTNLLKLTNTTLTNNSRYGIRLATLQNRQYVVKELKSQELTQEFLKTISEWTHLRNDSIVTCRGITLWSPLSMLLEYLPLGSLDEFLKVNKSSLNQNNLIECTSYLSRALWYLYENSVVHGHIRCHNLLVSEYSDSCFKVKLSDPISDNDINVERLWLPPEYLSPDESSYSSKRLTHSVDVWAFGTTVWQIFSYGLKPDSDIVLDLIQPSDCPNEIWTLVGECWITDCGSRKQPHSIWRDVHQIFYESFNSRRNDYYSKPVFDDQKPPKPKWSLKNWSNYKPNSFLSSTFSLSSGSITSAQSASTYLANSIKDNERSIGSQICPPYGELAQNGFDGVNHSTELPWIIELNQIKLGKVIGSVSIIISN